MNRKELVEYFLRIRKCSEDICKPLANEDYVPQPIMDVSPPKWHLAHVSWFFETVLLKVYNPQYQPYHPQYGFIFNSYYESFGKRVERPTRGTLSRPTVQEVMAYRSAINQDMCELIETLPEESWETFHDLVVLGLNHEQQHQELLLTDIKYIYSHNPLQPAYLITGQSKSVVSSISRFLEFEGGVYEIGHPGNEFGFDNEMPSHKVYLNDFKIQNRLVTNREYLEFIEDQGYQSFEYWLSDGWTLLETEGWNSPLFWEQIDGKWFEFTLAGLQPVELDAPVCHVSYYEAEAFAEWTGKRLPTEPEWEIAVQQSKVFPNQGNFMDSGFFQPQPLSEEDTGQSLMHQAFGDVWEWTGSAYLPYPGYRRQKGALGEYNSKFMINQMVLKGGSCATPQDHIRTTYRNFFQPDKRWQFMGLRLAETV